ncbi:hypothetical protein, variant 1 [Exophiala oligosperma]|uniref:Protein kinase domain-containing protein n=1 Tax=Exophiala oligosperma TaxID=215243 RepID=A0A0D2DK27_9EURO|nr:hypothetical protein, variant 1 [Exophiala oligosperma]KIW36049.1 hypothetical protein, variant 1 [Exophiala oligosperma]
MRALDFLAAHNLTHGKLNLTNIWVSRAGKVIIAEPELCRRTSYHDKILGYRDVQDVGKITMTLVTKSTHSERKPDPQRYSLRLVDFLSQTLTESASHLLQGHGRQGDLLSLCCQEA